MDTQENQTQEECEAPMDRAVDPAEVAKINAMTREAMCRLWRNAPAGHPYFDTTKPYYAIFKARFDELGGFSRAISKKIG